MPLLLTRLIRRVRRKRSTGIGLVLAVVLASVLGNALTFYFFDRPARPDLTPLDSLWYSIISITTIGYGDLSASSLGARLGTVFFIILTGLAAFTAAASLLVDWILEFQQKERAGMLRVTAKNHLILVNFPGEARVRQIVEEFTYDPDHRDREVIIVSDQIESLPFSHPNVSFVRGSPLEDDTYRRANISLADRAIVLSTGYDDPASDSLAASVITLIQHLNPKLRAVAECLNPKHALLFGGGEAVSLVYPLQIANNLLVQEAQDPGVHLLTQAIISNRIEGTLASTEAEDAFDRQLPYADLAKNLLDHSINLAGVIRDGKVHLSLDNLVLATGDTLVYISAKRHAWRDLRPLVG